MHRFAVALIAGEIGELADDVDEPLRGKRRDTLARIAVCGGTVASGAFVLEQHLAAMGVGVERKRRSCCVVHRFLRCSSGLAGEGE